MKALSLLLAASALLSLAATAASADDRIKGNGSCRQYVPSAGMTIAVECPQATTKPTPAPAIAPGPAQDANPAPKPKTNVSYKPETTQEPPQRQPIAHHRDAKVCGDILERAQLGRSLDDDVKTLRRVCGS